MAGTTSVTNSPAPLGLPPRTPTTTSKKRASIADRIKAFDRGSDHSANSGNGTASTYMQGSSSKLGGSFSSFVPSNASSPWTTPKSSTSQQQRQSKQSLLLEKVAQQVEAATLEDDDDDASLQLDEVLEEETIPQPELERKSSWKDEPRPINNSNPRRATSVPCPVSPSGPNGKRPSIADRVKLFGGSLSSLGFDEREEDDDGLPDWKRVPTRSTSLRDVREVEDAFHFVQPTLTEPQLQSMVELVNVNQKEEPHIMEEYELNHAQVIPEKVIEKQRASLKEPMILEDFELEQADLPPSPEKLLEQKRASLKVPDLRIVGEYDEDGNGFNNSTASAQHEFLTIKLRRVARDITIFNKVCAPPLKINIATFVPPYIEKTDEQYDLIQEAMQDTFVLSNIQPDLVEEMIINAMDCIELPAGEVLIDQSGNEDGAEMFGNADGADDHFYIVEQGRVDFEVDGNVIDCAYPGTSFGQEKLLYRGVNQATVKAAEDEESTKLFRLDQATFRAIMQKQKEQIEEEERRLATAASSSSDHGERAQGKTDRVDSPEDGLMLQKSSSSYDAQEGQGSSAYVIPKHIRESVVFQQQEQLRDLVQMHLDLEDLERIRLLGEGQFGEVWLVEADVPGMDGEEEDTIQEFALKVQPVWDEIRGEDARRAIELEVTVLQDLHHPFIVNLIQSYETDTSIGMLLGLVTGGELWDVLHREDPETGEWSSGLGEEQAKFYSWIITDTLSYIHSKNYVYRDLKPENVMLDNDGYPILVDFGFAKQLPTRDSHTYTFCGTPNYVAPEIIRYQGHNAGVDHWALGVMVYEMIAGEHPFYYDGMDQNELFRSITEETYYEMSDNMEPSAEVQNLLDRLLEKNPKQRLGNLEAGTSEILEHDWFNGLDPDALRNKQIDALAWLEFEEVIDEDGAELEEVEKVDPPLVEEDGAAVEGGVVEVTSDEEDETSETEVIIERGSDLSDLHKEDEESGSVSVSVSVSISVDDDDGAAGQEQEQGVPDKEEVRHEATPAEEEPGAHRRRPAETPVKRDYYVPVSKPRPKRTHRESLPEECFTKGPSNPNKGWKPMLVESNPDSNVEVVVEPYPETEIKKFHFSFPRRHDDAIYVPPPKSPVVEKEEVEEADKKPETPPKESPFSKKLRSLKKGRFDHGVYKNVKSPQEKRSSIARRGLIDGILGGYLDEFADDKMGF